VESLAFIPRNIGIALDERGGAVPGASRRSDGSRIGGRWKGKCRLFGVSLAVTDRSEGKVLYLGRPD